jgi:NADH pyrophosphatase NudC (nudix superfamily)
MRYLSGDTENHDHEVDEARWFEIKAAKKALKYVNEKRLIDLGLEYLEREGDAVFEFEPLQQPAEELELEAMRDSSAS